MKKVSLLAVLLTLALVSFSFVKTNSYKTPSRAVSKSLAFPVAGKQSDIGSYWGASRGGGRRKHKGIDIFARKGTAVVAISDGIIVGRERTPVGGKTLWLKSSHHSWTAYYAHLDKQLVKEGQYVHKGQVIGTVGKTGNARTTPPHLHFGIYTGSKPVNPLPYVKHSPKVIVSKTSVKKMKTVEKKISSQKKKVKK